MSNYFFRHAFIRFIIAVLLIVLVIGCCPFNECTHTTETVQKKNRLSYSGYLNTHFIKKGYGKLEMSIDGKKHRVDFDITTKDDGDVSFRMYTAFGTEVANMRFTTDSCHISFQGRMFRLAATQLLDTLGIPWASQFSVNELQTLLCGVIPDDFLKYIVTCEPFENHMLSRKICCADQVERNKICFLLRFNRLSRIILDYSVLGNSFLITQSNFKRSIPYKIVVKTDIKNYCKLMYHKVLAS